MEKNLKIKFFQKGKKLRKDFIKILQNDWFSQILPMSFESFPIPMCKQVCSKKSTEDANKSKGRVVEMGGLGSREYIKL